MSRVQGMLIACFAVGPEAVDNRKGELHVIHSGRTLFVVRVNNGTLPDGRPEARFTSAALAFGFVSDVLPVLFAETISALSLETWSNA